MHRRWSFALLGIALVTMGAHPAPKGQEVTVKAGHTLTEYVSESTNPTFRYVASGLQLHVGSRTRFDNNIVMAAQVDADHGIVSGFEQKSPSLHSRPTPPSAHIGDTLFSGGVAGRVGWHGEYFGGELGAAFTHLPEESRSIFASSLAWVGKPELAYLWASNHASPLTRARTLQEPFVGVGHRGKHTSWWWGTHVESRLAALPWNLAPIADPFANSDTSVSNIPFVAGATIEVSPGVRLGIEYSEGDGRLLQTVPDTRLSMVVEVEGESRNEW